jgi:DegV family protein with EDD domain
MYRSGLMAIHLVCDSTADLDAAFAEANSITVVPLRVIFGEEELRDFVDIGPKDFYARMRQGGVHPRTSQPTPAEFEAVFKELAKPGDTVICTTISAEMSGTFSSASQAKAALPDADIRLVDARSVSAGHNVPVRRAVAAREAGKDATAIVTELEELIRTQRILFIVESLEYLRRGGRIGGAQALLGTVLSIKPVLTVLDGKVAAFDKVRTMAKADDRLFAELAKSLDEWGGAEVTVAHADSPERAQQLAERAQKVSGEPARVIDIGPVIGCHVGPGTVGIGFSPRPAAGA